MAVGLGLPLNLRLQTKGPEGEKRDGDCMEPRSPVTPKVLTLLGQCPGSMTADPSGSVRSAAEVGVLLSVRLCSQNVIHPVTDKKNTAYLFQDMK